MPDWRTRPAAQQPEWPDPAVAASVAAELAALPPLVVPAEVDTLRHRLASVAAGEAFLLQGGDCAGTFVGTNAEQIREKLKTLLQMAVVLTYGASVPVVKVGRIAGQYAKPRSRPVETVDGRSLPSYRGDAVNDLVRTVEARTPDPRRMIRAYHSSAATLNLLRSFATGGEADLRAVHDWNKDFVRRSPAGRRYESLATDIDRALAFMAACGLDLDFVQEARGVELYSSHEALLLEYESALTRFDERGRAYDLSAHLVWIGERTRALDGAHVAFARGLANPVGVKLGPGATPEDAAALVEVLDPAREPGRMTLICRFGADNVFDHLPALIRAVKREGRTVVWSCDPMHGNTIKAGSGYKTRPFELIMQEVQNFFDVHQAEGTHAGGVHLEMTGKNVTECTGGARALTDADLHDRYHTYCDPRLNAEQALEIAFLTAELVKRERQGRERPRVEAAE